jgi:hypothetical protein
LETLGGFTPHGIKDFLQWRKETDRAIEILDLTIAFDAFDHIDEFGFLEEMTGLTVRWKYRDEIHEYVCGTGSSQAVLDRLRELLYMECVDTLFDPDDLPDDLEFVGESDENGVWEDESHDNILSEDDSEWPLF